MPTSTSIRRQLCNNGTTRHYTPLRGDTDRNDPNLVLTFQSQCTAAAEIQQARCNHSYFDPEITPQTKPNKHVPNHGLPIMQEELPVIT